MNILITAGGTSEPIDRVRSISNTGTGRLGSLVADELIAEGDQNVNVFYVCSHNAIRPRSKKIICVEIGSVAELQAAVTELMVTYSIDAVIHSMAVSDYRVRAISTPENLTKLLHDNHSCTENDLLRAILSADIRADTGKISSQIRNPLILLEQTPKILPLFRQMAPKAVIIGFKLLSGVSRAELFDTAYRLLLKNGCDYVLANDATRIQGDFHEGYLIDSDQHAKAFGTKQEIANGIVKAILRKRGEQV